MRCQITVLTLTQGYINQTPTMLETGRTPTQRETQRERQETFYIEPTSNTHHNRCSFITWQHVEWQTNQQSLANTWKMKPLSTAFLQDESCFMWMRRCQILALNFYCYTSTVAMFKCYVCVSVCTLCKTFLLLVIVFVLEQCIVDRLLCMHTCKRTSVQIYHQNPNTTMKDAWTCASLTNTHQHTNAKPYFQSQHKTLSSHLNAVNAALENRPHYQLKQRKVL